MGGGGGFFENFQGLEHKLLFCCNNDLNLRWRAAVGSTHGTPRTTSFRMAFCNFYIRGWRLSSGWTRSIPCPGSHQERLALDNEIQPEESDLLWAVQGENLIAINTPLPKIADTEYLALISGDLELVWSTFFTDPFQILGDL